MGQFRLEVLYEDNHLLVVNKPANLPVMGVREPRASLLSLAKGYVKQRYAKPGEVYLGVVSRLDTPVTGAIVFARTSKAARRLTEQFRDGRVVKLYWALVEGTLSSEAATWTDWLRKDERRQRMAVTPPQHSEGKEARLSYRVIAALPSATLVEVRLETGRKHQIRAQLAHRGHPILGDRKYDSRAPFPQGIALHSRELELIHPVRKEPLRLVAPVPGSWRAFGI